MSRKKEGAHWPDEWLGKIPADAPRKPYESFFVEVDTDETFHIGQSYENTAAKTLECRHCGGREFNVGQGGYFTAIRCVRCEWEECIHDG